MAALRTILLRILALPKTIIFNFRYLPLSQAWRLPFVVSHRVWLFRLGGHVTIEGPVRTGMISVGFGEVTIFDQHRSRTIWDVSGSVVFMGSCGLGHGSRISVARTARLELGDRFTITAQSAIVCHHAVSIGAGTLFSWEILVMDTDFHPLTDAGGTRLNPDAPVVIGNDVWVGCRATILKGAHIPDGTVVAATSLVTRSFTEPRTLVGGSPATVLRRDVRWAR